MRQGPRHVARPLAHISRQEIIRRLERANHGRLDVRYEAMADQSVFLYTGPPARLWRFDQRPYATMES